MINLDKLQDTENVLKCTFQRRLVWGLGDQLRQATRYRKGSKSLTTSVFFSLFFDLFNLISLRCVWCLLINKHQLKKRYMSLYLILFGFQVLWSVRVIYGYPQLCLFQVKSFIINEMTQITSLSLFYISI